MYKSHVSQCDICLRLYLHMPHNNPKCRLDPGASFTLQPFDQIFPNPHIRLSYCIQCRNLVNGGPFLQRYCDVCSARNYKSLLPENLI